MTNDSTRGIQWGLTKYLIDLDFADDICLLAHKLEHARENVCRIMDSGERVGLKINWQKTVNMRINNLNTAPVVIDGNNIGEVEEFCYLGSVISKQGGAMRDVEQRIKKAKAAFAILLPVWNSNKLSKKTKLRIFNTNVKSVLLYACETWLVTKLLTHKIQTFINRCLRRITRTHWPVIISNENLLRLTHQEPIDIEIRRRKWYWLGHTLRKPDEDLTKSALTWNPQGSRRRGRPVMTWRRTIDLEAKQTSLSWGELRTAAQNRIRWKCIVEALCSR